MCSLSESGCSRAVLELQHKITSTSSAAAAAPAIPCGQARDIPIPNGLQLVFCNTGTGLQKVNLRILTAFGCRLKRSLRRLYRYRS